MLRRDRNLALRGRCRRNQNANQSRAKLLRALDLLGGEPFRRREVLPARLAIVWLRLDPADAVAATIRPRFKQALRNIETRCCSRWRDTHRVKRQERRVGEGRDRDWRVF